KQALEKDRLEQEKLVKAIQKDKKKYSSEINKKKKESQEIDRKIDRMVKDAIAAANKKAMAEAKTTEAKKEIASAAKANPNKIVLTKEAKVLADNFTSNKGRLPWPVPEGYISSTYGEHPSPLDSKIMIKNSGLEITTSPNTDVRAVFGGEVGEIQVVPGSGNKIVYIRHGNYITVYFNLKSISVSSGDKVSTKQSIGKVATSPSGKTVLKFFVLQNTSYLNPQSWITGQ
ncbi:MAG: peptidase M23, partial [Pedobacter sp.]